MIDGFFRSFYGGIFLEDKLHTSSRTFEFTFKMFSQGSATLPANGMQAIPEQLAARLPVEAIRLDCRVDAVEPAGVVVGGETIRARQIVLAVDGENAGGLVSDVEQPKWNSTVCLYYSADESPINGPLIALKGDRGGLINNICVPSTVAPGYAPAGKFLVCVSVLGELRVDESFERDIRKELIDWFGSSAMDWRLLRMESIRKALPVEPPGHAFIRAERRPIFCCGDFTTSGSIEGAIISGLRVATRILES
jgi:phytoene dehydrogenase-like protein